MRLNKMRLAAAMMSAVMAASTMSTAVFAEDLIVDEGVEVVVNEGISAEDEIVEDQVELADTFKEIYVDKEGKVYKVFVKSDGTSYNELAEDLKADKVETEYKDCENPRTVKYTIKYNNVEYQFKYYPDGEPKEHVLDGENVTVTDVEPTCVTAGTGHIEQKCTVCKEMVTTVEKVEIPKDGSKHRFSSTKTTYEPYNNVVIKNGLPVLDEPDEVGYYYIITEKYCETEMKWIPVEKSELQTLQPVKATFDYAYVDYKNCTNVEGYVGDIADLDEITRDEYEKKLDEKDFVLTDCSKPGEVAIVVVYTNGLSVPETLTVSAHHTPGEVSYKAKDTADDKLLGTITDENGKKVVISKSCHKDIPYTETVTCASPKCDYVVSKEDKVAKAAGAHTLNAEAKAKLDALVNSATTHNGYATQADLEAFMTYADGKDSGIEYTASISKCEDGGTVTASLICKVCQKPVGEATVVKIGKLTHSAGTTTKENIVKATCAADGSYDLVTRCKFCGEVMHTTKVSVPALAHTYAKDGSGIGIDFCGDVVVGIMDYDGLTIEKGRMYPLDQIIGIPGYSVTAKIYDTCTVCGNKVYGNDIDEYNIYGNNHARMAVKVVDVKKQANGNPGSITLNAVFTATTCDGTAKEINTGDVKFDYYTDLVAYLDRNPDKAINGLHYDNDNVWRYYKDGEFQKDYTGLLTLDDGRMFYITKGELNTTVEGLQLIDGTWYFFALGQVQTQYTGLALYDGEWFYLTNGILDTKVNGLVPYDGKTFLFADGRLVDEYTGLWFNTKNIGGDDEWYYITNGWVRDDYTGSTVYDGVTFQVVNGKLVK